MSEKKFTRASFKKFLKDAGDALEFKSHATFDSMTDGRVETHGEWHKAERYGGYGDEKNKYTLGVIGVWLVTCPNYFSAFEEGGYKVVRVSNCCGSFSVRVRA